MKTLSSPEGLKHHKTPRTSLADVIVSFSQECFAEYAFRGSVEANLTGLRQFWRNFVASDRWYQSIF